MLNNIFLSNFLRLRSPYKITFACTYRCNLKCKTCFIWKKKKSGNELSLEEIEKIFRNTKIQWLNLTGGEPFLREDIVDVVEIIVKRSKPYIVNITTNGFLTDKIIELIREIKKINSNQIFMMVTGLDNKKDLIKAIELRVNYFVEKPIKPKKFKEVLEDAIALVTQKKELGQTNKTGK